MNTKKRRGIVLLLVLVVVAMLAFATLSFCNLMLSERRAAQTSGRQARARALAQSGAEVARQFLDRDLQSQTDAGGIYDNSQRFAKQLAADDPTPSERGCFTIIAPKYDINNAISGVRYGLQDESMRINLNTLLDKEKSSKGSAKSTLMALPGMTDEICDAILDWLDSDATPRENGAEADYYASLTPPYAPRNGAIGSIEELLLVRGVTPQLLFGLDAVRMGLIDSAADNPMEGVDNSDGSMDHGWAAYLTLYSAESTTKSDGTQKINLNGSDLQKLHDDLTTALDETSAMFIVAYRAGGKAGSDTPSAASAVDSSGSAAAGQIDISKLTATVQINSVLDLVGATATVTPQSSGSTGAGNAAAQRTVTLRSPFTQASMSSDLPKLLENTTCSSEETIRGRININQAPRVVLLAIPGMTVDIVDQIVAKRIEDPKDDSQDHRYETWPLSEGVVPLKTMKSLLPFITTGGKVYRAQVLGTFEGGGPTARLEVMLDASKSPTKLLFWKDVSRLPNGFPVESAAQEASSNNP
jgi:DNA uptake protein ComE-like DNA-binding protein